MQEHSSSGPLLPTEQGGRDALWAAGPGRGDVLGGGEGPSGGAGRSQPPCERPTWTGRDVSIWQYDKSGESVLQTRAPVSSTRFRLSTGSASRSTQAGDPALSCAGDRAWSGRRRRRRRRGNGDVHTAMRRDSDQARLPVRISGESLLASASDARSTTCGRGRITWTATLTTARLGAECRRRSGSAAARSCAFVLDAAAAQGSPEPRAGPADLGAGNVVPDRGNPR
jgi:hypothetical protein